MLCWRRFLISAIFSTNFVDSSIILREHPEKLLFVVLDRRETVFIPSTNIEEVATVFEVLIDDNFDVVEVDVDREELCLCCNRVESRLGEVLRFADDFMSDESMLKLSER